MRSLRQFVILGLFLLAGFLTFSNTLNSYFLSDDFVVIGNILSGKLSATQASSPGGFFRPILTLSLLVDTRVWGIRPLGFHLTNVTLHALNAFFAFILSFQLLQNLSLPARKRQLISLAAGVLFLLHPSHTEAVSWIIGRVDLLATVLCLASLMSFAAYQKNRNALLLGLSFLTFTMALLTKESAICLPFLVLVIGLASGNVTRDSKSVRHFLKVMALFFLILVVFVVVRYAFIGSLVGGYGEQHLNFSPGWLRVRLLQASLRAFLPALPSQWSVFLLKPLQSGIFGIIALVFSVIVAILIMIRRKRYRQPERQEQNRFLLALLSLFLFSLLPVINLRLSLYDTQGERWIYLPSIFTCLALSYLSAILVHNTRVWVVILICLLGFYSLRLYQTNRSWREAAELARSIKDDLVASATSDRLVILNAPDNLRGVPVFHNGLPEALKYFQVRKDIKLVEIIAFQNLQSVTDQVAITRGPESLTIHLLNNGDSFSRQNSSECFEIVSQTNTSLELRAKPCSNNVDLFFFDKGRMTQFSDR